MGERLLDRFVQADLGTPVDLGQVRDQVHKAAVAQAGGRMVG
ncbi:MULTISPECIES: hypothetical protein [unclassified Streptomyces]|nr:MULTISPECIES: hypothetical protein [unclassified Streptomyces]